MTKQEIYTKVRKHLLTQGEKATQYSPSQGVDECRYRTYNGLSCAVGCLILDELYTDRMEGASVPALYEPDTRPAQLLRNALNKLGIGEDAYPLLARLQCIHDSYSPHRWKEQLDDVALEFNLEVEV